MTIPTEVPSLATKAPKPPITANWALFTSSIMFGIIAILSLFNPIFGVFQFALEYTFGSENPLPIATFFEVLLTVLIPVLLVLGAVLGFVLRKPKVHVLFVALIFALWYLLDLVFALLWASAAEYSFEGRNFASTLVPVFVDFNVYGLAKFLFIFVGALAVVSLFVKPREPKPAFAQVQPLGAPVAPNVAQAPAAAPAPNYVAPAPGVPAMGAPSQLPIFALVAAFIVPLAGIIMGHISLNQMNKGQISSQNRTMAIAGLALGYVFMALGFLAGIILIVVILSNPYLFSSY